VTRRIPERWWLRPVGYGWFVGWGLLLWAVHAPWEELGGLVGERLRWLERFVFAGGWIVGATAGELARGARRGRGRWLIYPVGIAAALTMTAFARAGWGDVTGVVFNGVLAYVSGGLTSWLGVWDWCRGGPAAQDLEDDARTAREPP
jgi:hypothetical protein